MWLHVDDVFYSAGLPEALILVVFCSRNALLFFFLVVKNLNYYEYCCVEKEAFSCCAVVRKRARGCVCVF